jgi:limonene-1,2-epoxide hydrolase
MQDDSRIEAEPATERPPLNAESIKTLWSRTYNTHGKPDWSHIYPYYHPNLVFQDSIQRIEGIDAFVALCERLAGRCRELRMDIRAVAQDANLIFMEWTMTMMFRKFPSAPVHGCTVLTLHEDGRIVGQRDYYDLWGDIFDGIPWFRGRYRRFMGRYFG